MDWLDYTAPTLSENLALDEALLEAVHTERLGPILRIWEWPRYAVVLGANGSIAIDVNRERCESEGIEIKRRSSGGGTVLLGPGCLLYSVILPFSLAAELRDVTRSYRWILQRMAQAVQPEDAPPVNLDGISDLTLEVQKFSGNAQQRKANGVLHHGTLLIDFDLSAISRLLAMPERQPDYRADRPHAEFVRNLAASREQVIARLRAVWQADSPFPMDAIPWQRVAELRTERYDDPQWINRR
ncbi:lipoate--protein ligase family protein [Tuwongella immobilis]|uniref:BPL/LPL catalytic domain-containing protein n=1 Tax=Tuwongella immobilis TaxID=692036 RepID=A0A6C2YIN9_9BACT|nr:lipoate--protein ligase family protein [Tuwongella immobilis]VIP01276.1 biotin lipoate a b protein ligase : Biotin/lipoate A/B protein ligase OS=Planctomyces limnophilus (strain ATCC 43296 / DSM 3776 / IFAM 1008 / 290) GN=Plim_2611 PE=4 SV=1: BPL_LplA_LipB [Tuwongella immobilis]VTR97978.1 biotin lipoate a b protein ligase : Biotin/lipoate A/B protein ligase OS=Planctomyces limnophilus (strain ATCC 43296 / DSM 3776 / IFAM 1008 / 290) GN=Plim_2611 PE=4 SV=1: BPL_LplA_LipB [Tuwongella immobilis]